MAPEYRSLAWDSEFFGFPVVRINGPVTDLEALLPRLRADHIGLAYLSHSEALEPGITPLAASGAELLLVDRKVTYRSGSSAVCSPSDEPEAVVSELKDAEQHRAALMDLAIQSGLYSRFATDPHIPRERFETLYRLWMEGSLKKELADSILGIQAADKLAGMVTVRKESDGSGLIGLVAVDAGFRGRGYGEALMWAANRWFRQQGCEVWRVVTQGDNKAACRLYEKAGYVQESLNYFYHLWINNGKEERP